MASFPLQICSRVYHLIRAGGISARKRVRKTILAYSTVLVHAATKVNDAVPTETYKVMGRANAANDLQWKPSIVATIGE